MQVSGNEPTGDGQPGATAPGRGKKMYYSISEVCAMTGIGQHVLRYWEREFSLLRPKKNSGGRRAYMEKDIDAVIKIKHMLEDEKYTLQGAKNKLLDERRELRAGSGKGLRKSVSDKNSGDRVDNGGENDRGDGHGADNDNRGNGGGLLLGIRDELLAVLGLLERE